MTTWLDGLAARRDDVGRSSTASRVAGILRDDVTEGRLSPGVRLSEEEIGTALGVSRNTLREAFRILTHERLLVHEFNRGVFVRQLDAEDVRDLFRLRRLIEPAVVRASAPTDPLDPVRSAVEAGEAAAKSGDWPAVGTANMGFHRALVALANSQRLDELMHQLLAEMRLVFHVMADPQRFHEPYLASNRKLHDLLVDGRTSDAETELVTYLERSEAQLLEHLE